LLNEQKLLGFNGTGQRKDITNVNLSNVTKVPFVVSEPINATPRPGASKFLSALGVPKTNGEVVADDINIDTIEKYDYNVNQTLKDHNITKVDVVSDFIFNLET
jgi:hypothetical protein